MMRSMFSGVSGLRSHQTRMDVIGNNIANVNTVAFKSGRVTFQEVFSQTLKGSGAPDSASGRGGTNPMQVGLGISVASIDTLHTRGSLQRTDNPTDMAIDGEGFFVVKGGTGDTYRFTRAGNFGIDKLGNLVTAEGLNVQGWQKRKAGSVTEFDTEAPLEAINIYEDGHFGNKRVISAKESSFAKFAGNLDSSFETITQDLNATSTDAQVTAGLNGADTFKVPYTVYDKLGNDYTITLTFAKTKTDAASSTWFWVASDEDSNYLDARGTVTFNDKGKLTGADPANTVNAFATDIEIEPGADKGTSKFTVSLDFSNLTQFKADGSVKATDVDGYTTGKLVTFNVGSDGILTGIYSNGQQQSLGIVGVAFFENPAGLQKTGSNLYIPTTNSGDFKKAIKPGADGTGQLSPGTLEMSNVDLSKEFTEMITTQRGFQANSRIITTSDEMLQELVNLKR